MAGTADRRSAQLGEHIRDARTRTGMSVRELARRIDVSPSLISRIERGIITPSVGTLFGLQEALGVSLSELMGDGVPDARPASGSAPASIPVPSAPAALDASLLQRIDAVQRGDDRKRIDLAAGVHWERLTPGPDPIEFTYNIYEPGSTSCEPGTFMRHNGREYGYVVSGTLNVTLGFDTHELVPGDSIAFDSSTPHRLFNESDETVISIWVVVGR